MASREKVPAKELLIRWQKRLRVNKVWRWRGSRCTKCSSSEGWMLKPYDAAGRTPKEADTLSDTCQPNETRLQRMTTRYF